ncbi:MAG: hypothetical protein QNK15_04620 [Cycloclasticus sp.]|nr:hypothetical protein [Cycloclasticus sp.]
MTECGLTFPVWKVIGTQNWYTARAKAIGLAIRQILPIYELKTETLIKNNLSINDLDVILALANRAMRAL